MYHRKLTALDHPSPNNVNINNAKEYRSLILWLEDQKIRHYKIEDRTSLRQIESNDWSKAYAAYCEALLCPIGPQKPIEQLEWLLSFAVRLEYSDNVEKYNKVPVIAEKNTNVPKLVSSNPLDNLDFQSTEFKNGVNKIAKLLNVTQHPDHLVTLKAVSKLVNRRLSAQALQDPSLIVISGVPVKLEQYNLGFENGDPVLCKAAKILRLLCIQNLRELQTTINETIVGVQTITANPKTDSKLGKVGK